MLKVDGYNRKLLPQKVIPGPLLSSYIEKGTQKAKSTFDVHFNVEKVA